MVTALYNLRGIKPTKKEVAKQLQKTLCVGEALPTRGIDALKDRRGRPPKNLKRLGSGCGWFFDRRIFAFLKMFSKIHLILS